MNENLGVKMHTLGINAPNVGLTHQTRQVIQKKVQNILDSYTNCNTEKAITLLADIMMNKIFIQKRNNVSYLKNITNEIDKNWEVLQVLSSQYDNKRTHIDRYKKQFLKESNLNHDSMNEEQMSLLDTLSEYTAKKEFYELRITVLRNAMLKKLDIKGAQENMRFDAYQWVVLGLVPYMVNLGFDLSLSILDYVNTCTTTDTHTDYNATQTSSIATQTDSNEMCTTEALSTIDGIKTATFMAAGTLVILSSAIYKYKNWRSLRSADNVNTYTRNDSNYNWFIGTAALVTSEYIRSMLTSISAFSGVVTNSIFSTIGSTLLGVSTHNRKNVIKRLEDLDIGIKIIEDDRLFENVFSYIDERKLTQQPYCADISKELEVVDVESVNSHEQEGLLL